MMDNYKHSTITSKIIEAFYNVYNKLGYGFLEKVYENSMMIELNRLGLKAVKQFPITVHYDEFNVGEYFADIIVENSVIVELKAAENLVVEHEIQLVNYLKATEIEVGLLLNFGKEPQLKKKFFHLNLNHKNS
ncbi:MAG: GxxExxY protein [Ignavibacteriales bacterium]|nr:GxxExxY protein [Ignavibacteriales bacterium]